MKTTDLALAPVNKLTFLLGVGAIVVAIVYGACPTRPAPATEASEPPLTNQRIDDLRDDVDQRFDAVDQRFDAVDQRFDAVDQRFDAVDQRIGDLRGDVNQRSDAVDQRIDDLRAHVDGRFDDLRDLIVNQK